MNTFNQFMEDLFSPEGLKPIKKGRYVTYSITKNKLQSLFRNSIKVTFYTDDDVLLFCKKKDVNLLLYLVRTHYNLYIEEEIPESQYFKVFRFFPQVFQIKKEVTEKNHPHFRGHLTIGTEMILTDDYFGVVNYANGLPLCKNDSQKSDMETTTQINYEYIEAV